jgi:two-component system, LytTR family, response regulator
MKAIAVDDEPIALEVIKSHAAKVPFIQLAGTFTNALDAWTFLQSNPIDLVFLDIKMPDISGLEFYASLPQKPMVIFTTAYAEHAVTGFELDATDYLMKPVSLAKFMKACNKALELSKIRSSRPAFQPDYCFIKSGTEQVKIMLNDILYIEATGNYVTYVLEHKKILSRATFSETSVGLPEGRFIRIHRSFLVNIRKIDKADKTQVTIGGYTLPVSEAYSRELTEALSAK